MSSTYGTANTAQFFFNDPSSHVKTFVFTIENSDGNFLLMQEFSIAPCKTKIIILIKRVNHDKIGIGFMSQLSRNENLLLELQVKTLQNSNDVLNFNLKEKTWILKMSNQILIKNERSLGVMSGFIVLKGCSCVTELLEGPNDVNQLKEDLASAFLDCSYTDFVLEVGDRKFPVHKFVLAARSPVFKKMFEHNMKEKSDDCAKIIDVNDTIMEKFLKYVYTGILENEDCDTLLCLFSVADKYDVKPLLKTCRRRLMDIISKDTVLDILTLADMHNENVLKEEAVKFVCTHHLVVFPLGSWKSFLDRNVLLGSHIVHRLSLEMSKPKDKVKKIYQPAQPQVSRR